MDTRTAGVDDPHSQRRVASAMTAQIGAVIDALHNHKRANQTGNSSALPHTALLLAANEKLAFFANSQFQSLGDGRPFLSTLISSLSALSFLRLITVPCSLTSQRASQSPADATSPSTSSSSSSSVQYGRSCHSHGHMLSTAYITDTSFPINSQIGFG